MSEKLSVASETCSNRHYGAMSAIGPKQTSVFALHMSAFGGKADMMFLRMSAFAVAIGGKADMRCMHCMSLLLTQSGHSTSAMRALAATMPNVGGQGSLDHAST